MKDSEIDTKKLGLIGYPLGHSWSPEIHKILIGADYSLMPLTESELDDFFAKKDFDGINVTIPYKEKVIPYLDEMDESAKTVGAVNCIVNHDGILTGYNTDCGGLLSMLEENHIEVSGMKCAVLGSGGASKAAQAAVKKLNGEAVVVSRSKKENCITYGELYEKQSEFAVLINATPVGMDPNRDEMPVDLEKFTNLTAVVDIIANPMRTRLQFAAKMKGIPYLGGFEMLVRQAAYADLYFTGKLPNEETIQACMRLLKERMGNIVLIGMPTSGKSTLASLLSERTGREVLEMDDEIEGMMGMSIKKAFAEHGEAYFRGKETECAQSLRSRKGLIISCGGGVIKNEENMRYLSENGTVVWIRRDIEKLFGTESRPLSTTKEAMEKLFAERKDLYEKYSDIVLENNGDLEEAVNLLTDIAVGEEGKNL